MAMRKTSSVSLTFAGAMVNIPVGMYKAVAEKDLKFNNLHTECGSQVKMKRYCPTCQPTGDGPELTQDSLVKGYQISKGNFVKLDDNDFASVPIDTLKAIEIEEFVNKDKLIDPRFFEESYFIAPEPPGAKIFSLLFQAAEKMNAVAICKMVLREKEHIGALRPFKDGLFLLQTLYYYDELKDHSELKQNSIAASEKELAMAGKLIEALMSEELDLTKYKDNYREALTTLIEKKANGEIITPVAKAEAPAGDGMAALEAAIGILAENKKSKAAK